MVKNGTYFTNYDLIPAIGYQRYRELDDAILRKKYKLAARPAIPSLYDREARKKPASTDQATVEAIVSTVTDEVAVAPGGSATYLDSGTALVSLQNGCGRLGVSTPSYQRGMHGMESKWKDVAIRIYYYPDHALNLDRMLRSVKAPMAYYTEHFWSIPLPGISP